jgi:hypothetical protein
MSTDESTNDLVAVKHDDAVALTLPATDANEKTMTPDEQAEFERAMHRIEHFPREFGWLMVYVGVLGVVLPGIIGFPFVIAGGAVLVPGGRKWLSRWAARKPGRLVRASVKQIIRMADDLERRYPRLPQASS